MIEKQLEDRMHAAVADEPPLGFDPDDVVDQAIRRRGHRRSVLAATGSAVAVVALAAAAVATMGIGDQGPDVGTPTSANTPAGEVCQSVAQGAVPPLNFNGSPEIVQRLDTSAPPAITRHLPGVAVKPSSTGMIAYDCPPNVGTVYELTDRAQSIMLYLIHARNELDLAHDRYANDELYELLSEGEAADGAHLRVYRNSALQDAAVLVVVRFGLDGMITEASVSGLGPLAATPEQLRALASDPELRF